MIQVIPIGDDMVHDAVIFCLYTGHEIVAVGILMDVFHTPAGVTHQNIVQGIFHA